MSSITRLDENEILGLCKMNSTGSTGDNARRALEAYSSGLTEICTNGFDSGDSSTAHEVITALQYKMETVAGYMDDVNLMIDCLFDLIENDILAKEDHITQSVLE